MNTFGFRSVFSRLFVSVFLALIVFAVCMFLLMQVAHSNSDTLKNRAIAHQVATQINPFLEKAHKQAVQGNRLQARYSLVVIKKSFDIFDESLSAKIGLYDTHGQLILQTDNSNLPVTLTHKPTWFSEFMPTLWGTPVYHVQVKTPSGFIIWYETRNPPPASRFAGVFNLFTGMTLLLGIMSAVLWVIAKNMTKRLGKMSRQMNLMSEGDFSVRVYDTGGDEIAMLARGFNQAAQKIEQLINANNLLLAHASHEFRTPITRIRLQVEMMDMLVQRLDDDSKAKFNKRATAITKDLTGLNDLIESILLASRLDAGHALQQMQRVDFYELVASECQHYPKVSLYGESLAMTAQPKLLTHLIRNLLNNAMIHGIPPISVYVYGCQTSDETPIIPNTLIMTDEPSIDSEPALDLPDTAKADKSFLQRFKRPTNADAIKPNFAVLSVIDQGFGVPEDKREDIFSPFVRLKQEKKGSGLGLSLVRQIAETHGGRITTDVWQGHTRFLVILPIKALPQSV